MQLSLDMISIFIENGVPDENTKESLGEIFNVYVNKSLEVRVYALRSFKFSQMFSSACIRVCQHEEAILYIFCETKVTKYN